MSRARVTLLGLTVLALALAPASSLAQGEAEAVSPLEGARRDLVELRFEEALAALDALLADPAATDEQRTEALILRTQAHGALGNFDTVEQDYRLILTARPAFTPDETLTPSKAMQRFRKVRKVLVATVMLSLDPEDAAVLVDGRPAVPGADGALAVLAGTRVLRVEVPGFDAEERQVEVAADSTTELEFRLIPNARTIVVRTEPEGVNVFLDGAEVGTTRRGEGSGVGVARAPAELTLPNVPLGPHRLELRKSCFAGVVLEEMLTVDLLARSPRVLDTVRLAPARARLDVTGQPGGAELTFDGRPVGRLPEAGVDLCPGEVIVEARTGGRLVWREAVTLGEQERAKIEIAPRPNAILFGAEEWPRGLAAVAATFSTQSGRELPASLGLERPEDWRRVPLPPDTDLAAASLPPRSGERDRRVVVFSPILGTVETVELDPDGGAPPDLTATVWGMQLADSRAYGTALVAGVAPGGPAARAGIEPGQRVLAVSGRPVAGASEARNALAAHPVATQVVLRLAAPDGSRRGVSVTGDVSPVLVAAVERRLPPAVFAAWCALYSAADPGRTAVARMNLALLFEDAGDLQGALDFARRVRWGAGPGLGQGASQYLAGRVLKALGREREAEEAFRQAVESAGRWGDDEGPALAEAARDHLADLGVSLD